MSNSNLNLPQALIDLDERLLPQKCLEEIARRVALGYPREHMMIAPDFSVRISQELAMLHPDYGDDDEGAD